MAHLVEIRDNQTNESEEMKLQHDPCDLSIYIGPSKYKSVKINAHSVVLTEASPVFSKMMIKGNFKESETGEVFINDIKPLVFQNVLLYLYKGVLKVSSMEEGLEMFQVADKYFMTNLRAVCLKELSKFEITDKSFWPLFYSYLTQGLDLLSEELVIKIYKYLDDYAREILTHENFLLLDHDSLSRVIQRGSLKVDERITFDSIVRWAKAVCNREKIEPTGENQRKVLGNILYLIRFFRMSKEKFVDGPVKSGMLTSKEIDCMTRTPHSQRCALPPPWNNQLLSCPRETFWSMNGMIISGSTLWETTCFVYSTDAVVQSIDVWFSKYCDVDADATLSELNGRVVKSWTIVSSDEKKTGLSGFIRLDGPLFIKAYTCYLLEITNRKGILKVDFWNSGPWGDRFGEQTVFFGCRLSEIKDVEMCKNRRYWKKVFNMKPPKHDLDVIPNPSKVCLIFALKTSFC